MPAMYRSGKTNSTEFDSNTPHPVIHIMDDQKTVTDKEFDEIGCVPLPAKSRKLVGLPTTKRRYRKGIDTVLSSITNSVTNSKQPVSWWPE